MTDASCWIYVYGWHPDRPLTADERAKYEKGGYGQMAELGPGFAGMVALLVGLVQQLAAEVAELGQAADCTWAQAAE